ncbi:hypothetical protein [Bifidobacterium sp. ESL0825]|uniref:hypothetical protein n=1 Tax=Bifidobacterium sp. ESL0825 TaxID=3448587 RepID=UPI0040433D91
MKFDDEHLKEVAKKGVTGRVAGAGQQTDADSIKIIDYLIGTRLKRRRRGALIRNSFVRSSDGTTVPPLSEFSTIRGGSGVALKLYLAIIWLSAAKPYATNFEAADWARMIGLAQPDTRGAASVRRAIGTLARHDLITKEHIKRQRANRITLLREDGSGSPYTPPKANKRDDRYFAVPKELWAQGHIQKMDTAGLTMLLILLEEQHGTEPRKQWWTQNQFKKRFHISKDTRTKGTKELEERGLLTARFEYLRTRDDEPLTPRKTRKTYTLTLKP